MTTIDQYPDTLLGDGQKPVTIPFTFSEFYDHLAHTNNDWEVRYELMASTGYASTIKENYEALATMLRGRSVLEVGAGSAFLTNQLAERGINITAYDLERPTHTFTNMYVDQMILTDNVCDDIRTVKPHVVIMSWPDFNTGFGHDVVNACSEAGSALYYLGEGWGGCTGNDAMFELLWKQFTLNKGKSYKLNETYLPHYGIRDEWCVFEPMKCLTNERVTLC